MVMLFRSLSRWLLLLPLGTFLYDLIYEWVVHAQFKLRTTSEWIVYITGSKPAQAKAILSKVLPGDIADMILNNTACLVLIVPPVFFYILYRICRLFMRNGIYRYD